MAKKNILFLTGTRADFGKMKSLVKAVEENTLFQACIFVTGMHLYPKYGNTGNEVEKSGFKNIYYFMNQEPNDSMDKILANTISGLSNYLNLFKPDMIIVHGDRVEALAGAIVGALNNTLVAHIEGGEVSGTIDESIRHAISKLAHIHFVANKDARNRLIQMGEDKTNIFIIGSPDMDLMYSASLPSLTQVKKRYEIPFDKYGIFVYHPVTTNLHALLRNIKEVLKALIASGRNYVVIYPNNDTGADIIIEEYERLRSNKKFRIFPSVRFEYFLTLLRNAEFIIGNSSAGVREAPFYALPSINIGTRQNKRFSHKTIINVNDSSSQILSGIKRIATIGRIKSDYFGDGKSTERFINIITEPKIWGIAIQKFFIDRKKN